MLPQTFPSSHRLRKPEEYSAVYDARVRESRGPLTVYARPNALGRGRGRAPRHHRGPRRRHLLPGVADAG